MKRYSFTVTYTVKNRYKIDNFDDFIDKFFDGLSDITYNAFVNDTDAECFCSVDGKHVYVNSVYIPAKSIAEATNKIDKLVRNFISQSYYVSDTKFSDIEID